MNKKKLKIIGFSLLGLVLISLIIGFMFTPKQENNNETKNSGEVVEELRNNEGSISTKSYYLPGSPISLESGEYAIVKTKAYYSFDFYPINEYSSIQNLKWERIGWDSHLQLYNIKVWNEGEKVEFKTIEYLKQN